MSCPVKWQRLRSIRSTWPDDFLGLCAPNPNARSIWLDTPVRRWRARVFWSCCYPPQRAGRGTSVKIGSLPNVFWASAVVRTVSSTS